MGYRILVADDDPDFLRLLGELLSDMGHEVDLVEDGVKAFAKLESGSARYDLVLSDNQMPGMQGMELLRRMSALPKRIPVAIFTGKGDQETTVQALRLNAFDFLIKPIRPEHFRLLFERLELYLRKESGQNYLNDLDRFSTQLSLCMPTRLKKLGLMAEQAQSMLLPYLSIGQIDASNFKLCILEALTNAIVHGNLQVGSELRDSDWMAYSNLLEERESDARYGDRKVKLSVSCSPERIDVTVEDEGDGFEYDVLPALGAPDSMATHGRGLFLIRSIASELHWSEGGRQVHFSFYAAAGSEAKNQAA